MVNKNIVCQKQQFCEYYYFHFQLIFRTTINTNYFFENIYNNESSELKYISHQIFDVLF